jgi:RNA polymerase sigma-70 factor (ECF subfamily)
MTGAQTAAERATTSLDERDRSAPAELERLYLTHRAAIRRRCQRLLRDADEAEDAMQQVFLCAYRSLLAGIRPLHAESWLMTIARNECFGRLGRHARTEVAIEETDAATPDAFESAAITEALDTFRETMWELPEKQREALTLRELGGLSQREISSRMALSEPAVETLLVRARRRLRVRLAKLSLPAGITFPALLLQRSMERVPELVAAPGGAARVGVGLIGLAAVLAGASVTQHGDQGPAREQALHGAPPRLATPAWLEAPAASREERGTEAAGPSHAASADAGSLGGGAAGAEGHGAPVAAGDGDASTPATSEAGQPVAAPPESPSDEGTTSPAEPVTSPASGDELAPDPGSSLDDGAGEPGGESSSSGFEPEEESASGSTDGRVAGAAEEPSHEAEPTAPSSDASPEEHSD